MEHHLDAHRLTPYIEVETKRDFEDIHLCLFLKDSADTHLWKFPILFVRNVRGR